MQWILPTSDHEAASALRREVRAYLARHARPGADLDLAEIAFSELLTNAVEHAGTQVWVDLDWSRARPVITIHDLGTDALDAERTTTTSVDPAQPSGRGLLIARAFSRDVEMRHRPDTGTTVRVELDVERSVSRLGEPRPRSTADHLSFEIPRSPRPTRR
ncbi:MAG: ATP-binding protein [Actinomycetota bacterium]